MPAYYSNLSNKEKVNSPFFLSVKHALEMQITENDSREYTFIFLM